MERSSRLLSCVLASAALLVGCGVFNGSEAYPLATQPATTGSDGFAALVTGVIDVDSERGCVWLVEDSRRYPVLWPTDTTAQDGPFVIKLASGDARPGDRVSGGGGYLNADAVPELASCADDGEVAVFNANADIVVSDR